MHFYCSVWPTDELADVLYCVAFSAMITWINHTNRAPSSDGTPVRYWLWRESSFLPRSRFSKRSTFKAAHTAIYLVLRDRWYIVALGPIYYTFYTTNYSDKRRTETHLTQRSAGTGLCSYRVRGVDGSCAKHLTVDHYTVFYPLTVILIIISFPSPTHSFIPGLKPSFSANPSHCSLSFFLRDWLRDSPDFYSYFWAYPFLLFSFLFLHFLVVVSVRQIKLTRVSFRPHVK